MQLHMYQGQVKYTNVFSKARSVGHTKGSEARGKRHHRRFSFSEQICNLMYRCSIYMVGEVPGHALYEHFPV